MELLFSYGTLQLERVQLKTFGRLLRGTKDILVSYSISKIEISDEDVIATSGERYHPILKLLGIILMWLKVQYLSLHLKSWFKQMNMK